MTRGIAKGAKPYDNARFKDTVKKHGLTVSEIEKKLGRGASYFAKHNGDLPYEVAYKLHRYFHIMPREYAPPYAPAALEAVTEEQIALEEYMDEQERTQTTVADETIEKRLTALAGGLIKQAKVNEATAALMAELGAALEQILGRLDRLETKELARLAALQEAMETYKAHTEVAE